MDSLTTFGYDDLKHLHKAFAGTDFSACVDMQYSQQRTLVMPEVKRSLTDYIKMENNTIKYYRNMALNSCNNYVSTILPKIVDELFDKDLPEDDADIKRLFYACCENHLSNTKLLANITSQAEMCIDELNAGKKEYQKALLNTYSLANTTYKYHNMTWQTDKYGRVYKWSVTIDNSVVKAGRDSGLIKQNE